MSPQPPSTRPVVEGDISPDLSADGIADYVVGDATDGARASKLSAVPRRAR